MGVGNSGSRIGTLALALLAAAALCAAVIVGEASGALVGKDGRVYACYKAKGKRKGAVRLVAKKGKCHKGEKKVSWSAPAPRARAEKTGRTAKTASAAKAATGGEKGASATQGLEKQVQSLTSKVTQLESVLKGINQRRPHRGAVANCRASRGDAAAGSGGHSPGGEHALRAVEQTDRTVERAWPRRSKGSA